MNAKFIAISQGSAEWQRWRADRVTASDIPILAGAAPDGYPDANDLLLTKLSTTAKVQEETFAMRKGARLEPMVRRSFERLSGVAIPPVCVEHLTEPLGASLDGWNKGDGGLVAEIKYARWDYHDLALEGIVPDHFDWQIQTQLLVTDAAGAILLSYNDAARFQASNRQLAVVQVLPDPLRHERILELAHEFWRRVQQARAGMRGTPHE